MSQWPSSKATQVLAALIRIGWRLKRQSGSHKTLAREGWPDYVPRVSRLRRNRHCVTRFTTLPCGWESSIPRSGISESNSGGRSAGRLADSGRLLLEGSGKPWSVPITVRCAGGGKRQDRYSIDYFSRSSIAFALSNTSNASASVNEVFR